MTDAKDLFVVTVGLFAAVGLALGVVGLLSAGAAQTRFVEEAGGAAEEFGVAFLSVVHFTLLGVVLFLSPVLAAAVGVVSGTRLHDRMSAAAVAGGGSFVGFLLMAGLAVPLTNLGSGLASVPVASVPELFGAGAILTALVGAVAGVLGSLLY